MMASRRSRLKIVSTLPWLFDDRQRHVRRRRKRTDRSPARSSWCRAGPGGCGRRGGRRGDGARRRAGRRPGQPVPAADRGGARGTASGIPRLGRIGESQPVEVDPLVRWTSDRRDHHGGHRRLDAAIHRTVIARTRLHRPTIRLRRCAPDGGLRTRCHRSRPGPRTPRRRRADRATEHPGGGLPDRGRAPYSRMVPRTRSASGPTYSCAQPSVVAYCHRSVEYATYPASTSPAGISPRANSPGRRYGEILHGPAQARQVDVRAHRRQSETERGTGQGYCRAGRAATGSSTRPW
jgi:hypothetical protein